MYKFIRGSFNHIDKIKNIYIIFQRKRYWKKRIKSCLDRENKMTNKQYKKIINFYKPYYKVNKVFFDFYYQKTGIYSEKFIPHDLYYTKIDPYFNNWNEAKYIDNKCYYEWQFPNIKQPKTIFKRMNNIWYNAKGKIVHKDEVVKELNKCSEFFLKKAIESEGGAGVFYLKNIENFENTLKKVSTDLIIQEAIKQSKILNKLSSSSVNTIRIISLLDSNCVKIYSSVIRIGMNGSKTDNASKGGIICGIESNGKLKKYAFDLKGNKYLCHPETKLKFDNIVIPNYNKILDKIKEIAPNLPHFRLVSWDIALDENDEPVLIEANLCYGGLDFHQLNNGPLFGEDTEKILNEVFNFKERRKK